MSQSENQPKNRSEKSPENSSRNSQNPSLRPENPQDTTVIHIFSPKSPEGKAQRLIQRHLSEPARRERARDLFAFIPLSTGIAIIIAAFLYPPSSFSSKFLCFLLYAGLGLISLLTAFCFVQQIRCVIRDTRRIRAAEAGWVKCIDLITTSTVELQDQLNTAEDAISVYNRKITALRAEQNRLRSECDKQITMLENQIAMERKLMSDDGLDTKITFIRQILNLRRDVHP